MQKIRKGMYLWLRNAFDYDNRNMFKENMHDAKHSSLGTPIRKQKHDSLNDNNAISFKIIKGIGGVAIEYNFYDHKADEGSTALHIVPEDKDLAVEISHIITMQSLRN